MHSEACYGAVNNGNRSASDLLFVTLCHLRIAFDKKLCKGLHTLSLRDKFIETHLYNTIFEIRIMSCQHNIAKVVYDNKKKKKGERWVGSASEWPSVEYVSELTGRVSQLLVCCMGRNTESIMNRLSAAYAKNTDPNLKPSIKQKMLEFQLRKPESERDKARKKQDEEEENKSLSGDALQLAINKRKQKEMWGRSEAAQGKIWTRDLDSILRTFTSTCSYIQSKYELDLDVWTRLNRATEQKHIVHVDVPIDIENRIGAWKECLGRYKTSLRVALLRDSVYVSEQSDEGFRRMLSNVVFESILPMGSRREHYRSDATRHSSQPEPIQVFQDFCGSSSQTFIHWLMSKDNAKYVLDSTNEHPMYSLFGLSLIAYLVYQLFRVDFLDLYVVQASQVYDRKATHLTGLYTQSRRLRRPMLVCLMRRWYVLNKGNLIDPRTLFANDDDASQQQQDAGLFDSMVIVLAILKHEFDGKTEYGDNLQAWLDKLLLCGEASREQTHKRKQ